MATRTIADLERYATYLRSMISSYLTRIYTGTFETGEVDQPDMSKLFQSWEAHKNALMILEQEIAIASLSNSVKYLGEEYSIFQADKMREDMQYTRLNLEDLRNHILEQKSKPDVFRYKQQTISLEELDARIDTLTQSHYSLQERLERAKERTKVQVEMDTLLPSAFLEPEPEGSEEGEPQVIDVTSVE